MAGYYQTDNQILSFSIRRDRDKILFNHYIEQRENLQRMRGDLPRGQFYIAETTAAKDLDLTRWAIRELLRQFEQMGIITRVFKPPHGSKKPSIFQYNATIFTDDDPQENEMEIQSEFRHEDSHDKQHDKSSDTNGLHEVSQHDKQHDIRQSKKEYYKNSNLYSPVIEHLNQKTGKRYKATTAQTKRLINARLKDGFTLDDFIQVIDNKSAEWSGTDFQKYLRPETLFGPKFEGYLNSGPGTTIPEPDEFLNL